MNTYRRPVLFCVQLTILDKRNKRIFLTLSNFLGDCDLAFDAFLHSVGTLCLVRDYISKEIQEK